MFAPRAVSGPELVPEVPSTTSDAEAWRRVKAVVKKSTSLRKRTLKENILPKKNSSTIAHLSGTAAPGDRIDPRKLCVDLKHLDGKLIKFADDTKLGEIANT
ncbi:hypothetical protein GDO78_010905, partial [Eleutherodactylus coqui]